ncbi:Putative DNA repair protein XRCC4 [Colletotrichum destructivum]|uniref:DNA repair protein XRCC4 n=1 Tax=Colletotrichum destructivum TaxID=34406 RepID=A0AAX4IEE5_9PEZI|nr:Putative DNA repair protein XRCC4 [Colletotrichum destructivum]
MAPANVLRFPRSDSEGDFVVIQVTPTRSNALDVKLVGTDGVEPYAVSLRQDKVAALRVKNSPCTENEWVSILTAVLRQEPTNDIEVLADVENETILTLTIRKRGKEFTQRLGSIELNHSPRELIELFDWCGLSAQTANEAKEALASAAARATQLEESVRELKAQLDELMAAKEADESELLEKFRDLLNEKKVKIRQQQKLLASASVDPAKLAQVQSSLQAAGKGHAAAKSRPAKRKAAPAPGNDDSSSDEGFEKMDVDLAMEPASGGSDQEHDTTEDEEETASEDDEENNQTAPTSVEQPKSHGHGASQSKEKAPAAKKEAPPVKRELPFARKKPAPKLSPPPAGSETESDDEL